MYSDLENTVHELCLLSALFLRAEGSVETHCGGEGSTKTNTDNTDVKTQTHVHTYSLDSHSVNLC